jgi:hypothetical protein
VIADVAHMLNTPLQILMEMDWQEIKAWHEEVLRIAGKE